MVQLSGVKPVIFRAGCEQRSTGGMTSVALAGGSFGCVIRGPLPCMAGTGPSAFIGGAVGKLPFSASGGGGPSVKVSSKPVAAFAPEREELAKLEDTVNNSTNRYNINLVRGARGSSSPAVALLTVREMVFWSCPRMRGARVCRRWWTRSASALAHS